LLLAVLSGLVVLVSSQRQCMPGRYGLDCSCTSNAAAMLAAIMSKVPAICGQGRWTMSGDVLWADSAHSWSLGTDIVMIKGNFTMRGAATNAATISWGMDARNGQPSAKLIVAGKMTLAGSMRSTLLGFNVTSSSAFLNIEIAQWKSYNAENANNFFPNLADSLQDKWEISSSSTINGFQATYKQIQVMKK